VIVATLSRTKPQAYIVARYQRENCCAWWEQEAYVEPAVIAPKPILRDVANTHKPGQPPMPNGPTFLSRLYGINLSKAKLHRDTLLRLSLMQPEARRYSVRLIVKGEKCAS
jgi:hypothetical protein